MTQQSDLGPRGGMIVVGLGVGFLVSALDSSLDGRFLTWFFAGMLIALGAYLILPRRLREDNP